MYPVPNMSSHHCVEALETMYRQIHVDSSEPGNPKLKPRTQKEEWRSLRTDFDDCATDFGQISETTIHRLLLCTEQSAVSVWYPSSVRQSCCGIRLSQLRAPFGEA